MPVNTWTPSALASELRPWRGSGWRAVEAQHKVATMSLVHGSLADQALLEDILEESKPLLPESTRGLHWLLATPFRYYPLPEGSRFRRRNDPGVFYGAEDQRTACAEIGYWRLRMWMDSEGLASHAKSIPITLFEFHAATDHALDLSLPPLSDDREAWVHTTDYSATQTLAESARTAGTQLIRYESVRNPGGFCLALLSPDPLHAVKHAYRDHQQTWTLLIEPPNLTVWQRALTQETWSKSF